LVGGIAAAFLATLVIWLLGGRLEGIERLPDQGPSWYEWKLPQPTGFTRAVVWSMYGAHQLAWWGLIAVAQRRRMRWDDRITDLHKWGLGMQVGFVALHLAQTHWTYDGLAQDVSIWSSLASVAVLLVWVLLLENGRRGMAFGRPMPLPKGVGQAAVKYHGYYFAWAITYTLWYHPMEATSGHLAGFFYMFLLMVQGVLFFTPAHRDRRWTLMLEMAVVAHGTTVAWMQPEGLWPMFLFGFLAIFIVTQMHGMGWSRRTRWALGGAYLAGIVAVYAVRGPSNWHEVLRIAVIDYVGVGILVLLLWPLARWRRAAEG
jgi:hypothetical protein